MSYRISYKGLQVWCDTLHELDELIEVLKATSPQPLREHSSASPAVPREEKS